jgi:DNA-binding beta-propeller fold protein YncE
MEGEVRRMRAPLSILAAAIVVAGCGRADLGQVPQSVDYKLYTVTSTQTSQTVSVIDTRSHSVERSLPSGTASPDWAHLYSVQGTTLVDLDPQTGAARHTLNMPGAFQLPPATIGGMPGGLSKDGRWLVLESFDDTGTGLPTGSHFLLVDTSYKSPAQRIDIGGDFQFDAVSNDGQRIYLIEYLSNSSYRVRRFNVTVGQLDPNIIVDKTDGNAAMAGLRLSGIASPDGQWLYSVYIREHQGAFIHALNLENNFAICLDLPGTGYASSEAGFHWSLALSPDGTHLYAANGVMGVVADIDTGNGFPSLIRTIHIATPAQSASLIQGVEAKGFGSNGAVATPDGRTLVTIGTKGVVWIDTASLRATGTQLNDWRVWSLALSPNGDNLYAVSDGGMIAEVSMTGAHTVSTFAGGPGQPMTVIRVEAAQAP